MDAFTYQYVIGGAVFVVGLICAARRGYVGFRGKGLAALVGLLAGLGVFAGIQAYLEYAPMREAPPVAFEGEFSPRKVLGTWVDFAVIGGYFLCLLLVGTVFSRNAKSVNDYFFAGRRFGWVMIAFSLISTTVGSYSFVKYGEVGYSYGFSSTLAYFNDWFWLPLLIFGWLPILYFSRITSIPEFFERRFDRSVRLCATVILLMYLLGYVGINLFTMGKALNALVGWPVLTASIGVACVTAIYVTAGGQSSVIMTDLFQGILLLGAGLLILYLGVRHFGGWEGFWTHLPRDHRRAFPAGGGDASFSGMGVFWQDGIANTPFFYFLNQGMVMRFMSARSVGDARKATVIQMLILMPLAACVVGSVGWVGRALVHSGVLPSNLDDGRVVFITTEFLSQSGVFGLVMAALTAALMSSVDSLITGVSAVAVNDVYKPYLRPKADDRELLRAARWTSIAVALVGVCIVPVYMQFKSIYEAHAAMTAAVTPPLVMTLMLSVFWKRFTKGAALATLIGGVAAILVSVQWPQVIDRFAQGVPATETSLQAVAAEGFFSGLNQHKFMRACFVTVVSGILGVVATFLTRNRGNDAVLRVTEEAGRAQAPAAT